MHHVLELRQAAMLQPLFPFSPQLHVQIRARHAERLGDINDGHIDPRQEGLGQAEQDPQIGSAARLLLREQRKQGVDPALKRCGALTRVRTGILPFEQLA